MGAGAFMVGVSCVGSGQNSKTGTAADRFRIPGLAFRIIACFEPQKASIAAHERDAAAAHAPRSSSGDGAESPTLRLFALLERIAAHDRLHSLQSLVEDTGCPSPRAPHAAAARRRRPAAARRRRPPLQHRRPAAPPGREPAGQRHLHGARHAVLRALVDEVGESCNITASSAARWSTSTAWRPPHRCASTCTRARACRRMLGQRQALPVADAPSAAPAPAAGRAAGAPARRPR
jgi:hypothetical protein